MKDRKTQLLDFFTDNPSKIGLITFYWGWCEMMMDSSMYSSRPVYTFDYLPLWEFELVDEDEGGEDSYAVYTVWKVTDKAYKTTIEPFYIKFSGHYRSHVGSEYSGWKEVTPKTVTKEIFE